MHLLEMMAAISWVIVGSQEAFNFEPGPFFANIALADEINRATSKTQSAPLEAMQEGTCPLP